MKKPLKIGLITGLVLVASGAGAYWFVQRARADRQAVMAFQGLPTPRPATPTTSTRTVKNYTPEEIEEARKNGKTLPDMQNSPAQSNAMNDAVQRNLRTLEEINRINQMNQRLMEQQDRLRRQNRN